MQNFNCCRFPQLILLALCLLLFLSNPPSVSAQGRGMKTVATDALYGGAVGTIGAVGVSLLQEEADWVKNLQKGTGVGLILGLGFGFYRGYVMATAPDLNPFLLSYRSGNWQLNPHPAACSIHIHPTKGTLNYRFSLVRLTF